MMRQGRSGEAEQVCVQAADVIEPRMSTATVPQLDAWGWLLLRASAAAARNNKPGNASQYAKLAMLAGNQVGREAGRPAGRRFGPLSAALIGPENAIIAGRPGKAIALFKRLPRNAGLSDLSTWDRARLDAARAHIQIGDPRRATEILSELKRAAPEWLRHQQAGQDTVRELLDVMPRLTAEQRAPASFYEIT